MKGAVNQYEITDPPNTERKSYITGVGAPNHQDGATYIRCGTSHGVDLIGIAAYLENGFTIKKISDFSTISFAGLRNNKGQIEVKDALGSWRKLQEFSA